MLQKNNENIWMGLDWLRIFPMAGFCKCSEGPPDFIKGQGILRPVDEL
jgi:hypothetical protein